jgi:transposase
VKNQLQAIALNEALPRKPALWSRQGRQTFEALPLPAWTARRRQDNLELLDQLVERTEPLDEAVQQQAEQRPEAVRLMSHPGVGPITALAFVLTIGDPARFQNGKQVASYLGLIPSEHSSCDKRRLGGISKQGNSFLRMLLVEAATTAVRHEEGMKKKYQHRCHSKLKGVAKVAAARKLAVRLYWMLRTNTKYPEIVHNESSSRCPMAGGSQAANLD